MLYQPLLSDGNSEIPGNFYLEASNQIDACRKARTWFSALSLSEKQTFFPRATGKTIAVTSCRLTPYADPLGLLIPA